MGILGVLISMNIKPVAKRISSLPRPYLDILACISEGMSNYQIASKLGYKNTHSVATLIHEIYKRIGLADVFSRTEKRHLAGEAFKISNADLAKITLSLDGDDITDIVTYSLRRADRVRSVLGQGYEIDSIEVVFRKRND